MRTISRRIKKLESAWIPAESPESIRSQARIEAARRRIGEGQQAGRIQPQLPHLVKNAAENSPLDLAARLNLARAHLRAAADQERAHTHAG
jgi:hypothetical protein